MTSNIYFYQVYEGAAGTSLPLATPVGTLKLQATTTSGTASVTWYGSNVSDTTVGVALVSMDLTGADSAGIDATWWRYIWCKVTGSATVSATAVSVSSTGLV